MKSRVIFASLVLGLGLANLQAGAATTKLSDDSPAANKPASTMLVKGSEKQFALFIEQNANQITKNVEWQNFMSIVSLYNNNPVSVLAFDETSRMKFNETRAQLTKVLVKHPTNAEASRWINKADQTARMINLLWSAEAEANKAVETE